MPGWNFADVWEVVAQQLPDATAQVQGDRRITWRDFDRRANGVAQAFLDAGVAGAGQGRPVPLQRPRVPRVGVRRVQGRPRPDQHELPLPRRRARLPVGQRRRRRRSCSTAPSPTASRASATGSRSSSCGCGSTTAAARAPSGRRRTRPPPRPARPTPVQGAWGRDGDHLLLLYTGGTTGMPKGVMWRQDDLFRSLVGTFIPAVRDAEPDLAARPRRGAGARRDRHAGLPADARHRAVHAADRHVRRRLHGHPREPQPRRRGAAVHDRARVGELHRHRRRRLRQADAPRPRRRARQVRPVEPRHDLELGRDVQRGLQAGAARPPPRDDDRRRVLLLGGARDGPVGEQRGGLDHHRQVHRSASTPR